MLPTYRIAAPGENGMMRLLGLSLLTVSCLVFLCATSSGQNGKPTSVDAPKGNVDTFFTQLDKNKDGKLSRSEFVLLADRSQEKEKARQQLGQAFDKLDPANKGITREQFKRFLDAQKKK